ncbi:hypothetical protein ACFQVA_02020 [Actinomadura keratinilytica]
MGPPPVALLACVFLYPLVLVVQQSVTPDEGGTSLAPYAEVLASASFRQALTTTVWLALGSTAAAWSSVSSSPWSSPSSRSPARRPSPSSSTSSSPSRPS